MTVEQYNNAVDQYSDNVYRFILKSSRNEELAKDVVQDTYEKLWLKMDDVDGEKVRSYLFTAAYRTMLDHLKKEKRMVDLEHGGEQGDANGGHYTDLSEILHEALNRLPDIQRSVILLRDYEGYSYEEIGELTELSESQVKVYIYRARISLKKYLVKLDNVI